MKVAKSDLGGVAIEHVGPDPPERGQARTFRFQENQIQQPYINPAMDG